MLGILVLVLILLFLPLTFFTLQAGLREVHAAREVAPAGGRFVPAADIDMFVQEMGPPDGVPVVLVHGTGAWSETWRATMTKLAAAGFRAIAIDLPPFGYSDRPRTADYGKLQQGKRIVGVLDGLGIDRAILVGHSFGGGPTVEAALLAPQRVRAVALVDAALSVGDSSQQEPPAGTGLLALTPLRDAVVATFLTNPLFTQRLLQGFIDDPARATDIESLEVAEQVYGRLVRFSAGRLEPEADLATSWTVSSDGTIWTFELRQKYRQRKDLLILSSTYWTLGGEPYKADPSIKQRRMGHACEFETSMMLALAPALVHMARAEALDAYLSSLQPTVQGGAP
jgi:pimeloyl-ACP methyl ester carboxylesterase